MSALLSNPTFRELVVKRYGESAPDVLRDFQLDDRVFETIFAHKSVRHYQSTPLEVGVVESLAAAAQSASSSSNLQVWSLVAVQEPGRKQTAALLCGDQQFIRDAPLFLVFVADLARVKWVSEREGLPAEGLDYTEMFLLSALDPAFAAQNLAVAAESLGLGICYVGAARNRPRELAQLLNLPPRSIAVFGMTVGHPQEDLTTTVKPRLPQPGLLHYETYNAGKWPAEVIAYDQTMDQFYEAQGLSDHPSWSRTSAKRVATKESLGKRWELRQILEERGFALK